MKKALVLLSISLLSTLSLAKPSSEATKELQDYYYEGKSPILVDYLLCEGIGKKGEANHNECDKPYTGAVTKNKPVYIWMNYLVPKLDKGEKAQLFLQANQGGVTRIARNFDMTSGLRYRTWQRVTFKKAGTWEIKIMDETNDLELVKAVQVEVTE